MKIRDARQIRAIIRCRHQAQGGCGSGGRQSRNSGRDVAEEIGRPGGTGFAVALTGGTTMKKRKKDEQLGTGITPAPETVSPGGQFFNEMDITQSLRGWAFEPGQVNVRLIRGND